MMTKPQATIDPVDFCMLVSQAHASLNLKLDMELGTHHGLSLADFALLRLLSRAADGRMAVRDLVRPLGLQQSAVMRQLILLEKTGRVQREAAPSADGQRQVAIRPGGRRLFNEALETAQQVCGDAVAPLHMDRLPLVDAALSTLCHSRALAL